MEQGEKISTSQIFLGIALCIMTIIFVQQLLNVLFPEEGSIRVIAKLVADTALIGLGLGLKRKAVAYSILFAGIIRFLLIFFQLQGMNPILRVVAIFVTVIIIFIVGIVKFGRNISHQQVNSKE